MLITKSFNSQRELLTLLRGVLVFSGTTGTNAAGGATFTDATGLPFASAAIGDTLVISGETPTSFADQNGWGAAYVHNILHGQFRPSKKRCLEMATAFGDDPNIILALAGFFVPPENDHHEFTTMLNGLSEKSQAEAIDYLQYLKWKEDQE